MSVEKLEEQITRCKDQKKSYNREMDKKISELEKKRDDEIAAEATRTITKYHLTWEELLALKRAGRDQFKHFIAEANTSKAEKDGLTEGSKTTLKEENDDAKE